MTAAEAVEGRTGQTDELTTCEGTDDDVRMLKDPGQ